MLVRLFVMLALVLSTLPAPAAAAPPCHDEPAMAMAGHAMAMDEAPAPQPDLPVKMGKALCVGCIAPATLRLVRVAPPRLHIVSHGLPPLAAGFAGAALTPEPPPPRA
ncbi:hypothetical protein [Sphingomonas sp.]|uniref:hypothetical protein n=1 Tax=Sphingomonas sp. TaxID=28214 RepID=UPI0031E05EF2